jgi:hypothetical protein
LELKEEDLDYSESPYGTVSKTFNREMLLVLSNNPEKPVWLFLCSWNGDEINYDNPKMDSIIELRDKISTSSNLISRLRAKIKDLEEENMKLIVKNREYFDQVEKITKKRDIILPADYLGKVVKDEYTK